MSTGLLNQLETYYGEVETNHHDVTPDRVLGYLDRVREVPAPAPMPLRSRPRVWVAVGAAAAVLLLVALVPILVGSVTEDSPPATEPAVPSTSLPPSTTLPSDPEPTVTDAASTEVEAVDLEALLDNAIATTDRYWRRSGPERAWSPPGMDLRNTSELWFSEGTSESFRLQGRTDTVAALLLPAPETRLEGPVTVWINQFADEASAAAFVEEFVDPDVWDGMAPLSGRGGEVPVYADPFTMPAVGDEAFGFFWVIEDQSEMGDDYAYVAIAVARSGPVVAIVGNPIPDAGKRHVIQPVSEQDIADEATYLTASIVGAHQGEDTSVQPPTTTPFTEEEAAAIATVEAYHEALTQADYDAILRTVRLDLYYNPAFLVQTRYSIDPLVEAGAEFEATYCRPSSIITYHRDSDDPDGDPSGRFLEIKCVAGYRSPDGDSIAYRGWEYEDGKLRDPVPYYGRGWDPEDQ